MSGGNDRSIRTPSKSVQSLQITPDFVFTIKIVVIICAQIPKGNTRLQHMINCNEHGVGNSNCGAIFTSPGSDPLVLSRKVGVFYISGRFCALNQNGFQGFVPFSCFTVLAPACALVISWTQARPGRNMCRAGETAHVGANLREDNFRTAPPNFRQFINC